MLNYIGNVTVNGFPGIEKRKRPVFDKPRIPIVPANLEIKNGTKQILDEQGADGLVQWVKDQKEVLLTDTTFRDAHQSLLATRVRTNDFKQIADPTAKLLPDLFSLEMWGGATFDVAYRFLKRRSLESIINFKKANSKCYVPNAIKSCKCSRL